MKEWIEVETSFAPDEPGRLELALFGGNVMNAFVFEPLSRAPQYPETPTEDSETDV